MESPIVVVVLTLGAYLLGSLSSAIVVSRLLDLPDPRTEGSKNPGATNVLRLGGKRPAAVVLLFDLLKGVVPVVLGHVYSLYPTELAIIGFAAVIGHVYPIYYQFEGGKGVATALGVYFGLDFYLGALAIASWLLVLRLFHYSSAASLVTVALMPFVTLFLLTSPYALLPLLLVSGLVAKKHQANIKRLMAGTEPKTSLLQKASAKR